MGIPQYKIPLRKVRLPPFHEVKKYFERIDENLVYSNNGPLVRQLQRCLAKKYRVDVSLVTVTSSGTKSLQTILQQIKNVNGEKGASLERPPADLYCILPSFTFAASAMAIIGAGLKPIFLDIEEKSGQLNPTAVGDFLDKEIVDYSKVIAIMPVSPFGAKIDKAAWVKFAQKYEIELVYDEAWCFDSFTANSKGNSALSLHATKSFGCGEGGVIISNSFTRNLEYQSIINFGFGDNRESQFIGTNGKMSEYAAAVALTVFDNWSSTKNICLSLQEYYLEKMESFSNIKVMQGFDTSWAWGALPIIFREEQNFEQIIRTAAVQGIELRSWWKTGIHQFPAMKGFLCDDLKNTNRLTKKLINVPFFPEMREKDVDQVCGLLRKFDI